MIKIIAMSLVTISLLSACSHIDVPFLNTSTSTPSSTPTLTPTPTITKTPTLTLTPTITPTFTVTATPSATPYPLTLCSDSSPYLGTWTTEYHGMQFEAFICSDNTLIAIFSNQEFGETITINQGTFNKKEYAWEVFVDVDADENTGSTKKYYRGIVGADCILSLARWSQAYGGSKTVPFTEAFQINVWLSEEGGFRAIHSAEFHTDQVNKVIVLRGIVPRVNPNSKLIFSRYRFRLDDRLTYKTEWVTSNSAP